MDKINTDTFEQLNQQLNTFVNDIEETWYLIKHLMNEMDIEELYYNVNVEMELKQVYQKQEILVERFDKLKQICKTIPDDYLEMMKRHQRQMNLMNEYAQGLRQTSKTYHEMNYRDEVNVTRSNLIPIRYTIDQLFNIEGVIKDE